MTIMLYDYHVFDDYHVVGTSCCNIMIDHVVVRASCVVVSHVPFIV